jgi:hypothetical protein
MDSVAFASELFHWRNDLSQLTANSEIKTCYELCALVTKKNDVIYHIFKNGVHDKIELFLIQEL